MKFRGLRIQQRGLSRSRTGLELRRRGVCDPRMKDADDTFDRMCRALDAAKIVHLQCLGKLPKQLGKIPIAAIAEKPLESLPRSIYAAKQGFRQESLRHIFECREDVRDGLLHGLR